MFEVAEYRPPHIFVTSRRTGETYRFLVGDDGALLNDGLRFDEGDPRPAAVAFLYRRGTKTELQDLLSAG